MISIPLWLLFLVGSNMFQLLSSHSWIPCEAPVHRVCGWVWLPEGDVQS